MLHDIATREFNVNITKLEPSLSVHIDTVNETTDLEDAFNVLADMLTETTSIFGNYINKNYGNKLPS